MTTLYEAYLEATSVNPSNWVPVGSFRMDEEYNAGWVGNAIVTLVGTTTLTVGNVFQEMIEVNLTPGARTTLHLVLRTDSPDADEDAAEPAVGNDEPLGVIVRAWPCMVTNLEPFQGEDLTSASCTVQLADPLTYLSTRSIWGAYRATSVGQMLGGALSLAVGGDGKPTLTPALPGLPNVSISESFREELDDLPYSIAAGETLGEWLGDFLGMLGVRMEMLGGANGSVAIKLTDRAATGNAINMAVLLGTEERGAAPGDPPSGSTSGDTGSSEAASGEIGAQQMAVTGIAAYPNISLRGGVLGRPHLRFDPQLRCPRRGWRRTFGRGGQRRRGEQPRRLSGGRLPGPRCCCSPRCRVSRCSGQVGWCSLIAASWVSTRGSCRVCNTRSGAAASTKTPPCCLRPAAFGTRYGLCRGRLVSSLVPWTAAAAATTTTSRFRATG